MNALIRFALAALLVSAAMITLAADRQPQSPTKPPASGEQTAPRLDINQAELDAGVVNEPLADKIQGGEVAVSPLMAEIQTVMDQTRAEVAELAARAAAAVDLESRLAVQQEVAALKKQAELDILAIQARHAREAGNVTLAEQIEADIALIVSPPAPTPPAEPRPAPDHQ